MKISRTSAMSRRGMLKAGAGIGLGSVLGTGSVTRGEPPRGAGNVYEALGVKPVINAFGTVTTLGGSLMPPEVTAAWVSASRQFVDLVDIFDIDQQVGVTLPFAELHEDIRAAGEDAGSLASRCARFPTWGWG